MREKLPNNAGYRFNCDTKGCRNNVEIHDADPKVAWAHARGQEWAKRYLNDVYEDMCPKCSDLNDKGKLQ